MRQNKLDKVKPKLTYELGPILATHVFSRLTYYITLIVICKSICLIPRHYIMRRVRPRQIFGPVGNQGSPYFKDCNSNHCWILDVSVSCDIGIEVGTTDVEVKDNLLYLLLPILTALSPKKSIEKGECTKSKKYIYRLGNFGFQCYQT